MEKKHLVTTPANAEEIVQLLEDRIYEHNSSKLNRNDGELFSRIITDKKIIAGIAGWTWAGVCEITQLWVDEAFRKNGMGKMLLEEAEAIAKRKGCHTILVRSYGFQAPHFYEKYGYKIEYVMNDFPKGYHYYFFTKRIS